MSFGLNLRGDNKRCYRNVDIVIIIFSVGLMVMPFLDIYLFTNNGRYNVINWQEYYSVNNNNQYYTVGGTGLADNIKDGNNEICASSFNIVKYPVSSSNGIVHNVITSASNDIILEPNGSHDLVYMSIHNFTRTTIHDFDGEMQGTKYLPIYFLDTVQHIVGEVDYVVYTPSLLGNMIPSNWSYFWNNVTIYFYCINDNNQGFAYRFSNNESSGIDTLENINLATPLGNLELITCNLNISAHRTYDNGVSSGLKYDFVPSPPDIDLTFGATALLQGLFSSPSETISLSGESYSNLRGFLKPSVIYPNFGATICGYYITVNKNLNVSKLIKADNPYNLPTTILNSTGFCFEDNGIYLGKTVSNQSTLILIIGVDIIIITTFIAVIIIVRYTPINAQKDFVRQNERYCKRSEPR